MPVVFLPVKPKRPNIPSAGSASRVVSSPVTVSRRTISLKMPSPPRSATSVFRRMSIFGFSSSSFFTSAGTVSAGPLCRTVSFLANFERYRASSAAMALPPTV